MKITFVIPYFYPAWQYGGQPRSAFELARALVERGHSIQVLTTDSAGETRFRDVSDSRKRNVDGIDVYYYRNISNSLAYRQRIFWPPEFFRQIRERVANTDVIHIHELRSFTSVAACRAALRTGVPYIVSAHGGLRRLGKQTAKVIFDALWGKTILSKAAAFIAITPVEESDAADFGVETQRVHRLANVLDPTQFESLPGREAFRSRWKMGPGKIVLFIGRLHWVKGADLLVEAFRKARDRQSGLQLVVAGPDDGQETELRNLVQRLGLGDAIRFTGFLHEAQKLEALTGSDVTVVPSRSEVFALTAIESLVCGTPVLMSDACGLYPLPEPDQGVVPFESGNVNDLAAKLLMMAGAEPFRHNVAAGREFVLREFSPEAVAAKAESIYEEVVQRHG